MRVKLFLFLILVGLIISCNDPADWHKPLPITNEVEDWRDEIIYQVMIDRFADGDENNNYNVDRSRPSMYHGGDWQGVIDKIPYLKDLGVTALWISPVIKNLESDAGYASYHGYWAQDFLHVNPHFGDLPTLKRMVKELHKNGIKVLLDVVANHIGQLFYYDMNLNGQPDDFLIGGGGKAYGSENPNAAELTRTSEYDPEFDRRGVQSFTSLGESGPAPVIWFNVPEINRVKPFPEKFANPKWYNKKGRITIWRTPEEDLQVPEMDDMTKWVFYQEMKGDFPGGLKDLNTMNPDVQEALIEVFSYWIKEINLDGFRIDTVKHVEPEFWGRFCYEIRRYANSIGKNNFLMFGEVFDGRPWKLAMFTKKVATKVKENGELVDKTVHQLDSLFAFNYKYSLFEGIVKHGSTTDNFKWLMDETRNLFESTVPEMGTGLNSIQARVHFLDNHDVSRYIYNTHSVVGMTPPEEELSNEKKIQADTVFFPAVGLLMTLDGIPSVYYGTEQGLRGGNDPANREDLWLTKFRRTNDFYKFTKKMIGIRKSLMPLKRGDLKTVWTSDSVWGEGEDSGILAFERTYNNETVLVVVNTDPLKPSFTKDGTEIMTTSLDAGTLFDHVAEKDDAVVAADGKVTVEVQARGIKVLTLKK